MMVNSDRKQSLRWSILYFIIILSYYWDSFFLLWEFAKIQHYEPFVKFFIHFIHNQSIALIKNRISFFHPIPEEGFLSRKNSTRTFLFLAFLRRFFFLRKRCLGYACFYDIFFQGFEFPGIVH